MMMMMMTMTIVGYCKAQYVAYKHESERCDGPEVCEQFGLEFAFKTSKIICRSSIYRQRLRSQ